MKVAQRKMNKQKHDANTKQKLKSVIQNTVKRNSARTLAVLTQEQTSTPTKRQCAKALHEFLDTMLNFYKEAFVQKDAIVLPIRVKEPEAPLESNRKSKKGKK